MKLKNKKSHFYWLDLVRFLAALTVVIVHTRAASFVEYGALLASEKTFGATIFFALTRIGNEAVIIFFVLSGFLVGGRALKRISKGTFRPFDYTIDRMVRIFLPLIPALLLTAIVGMIIDGSFEPLIFLANIFSLQGVLVPEFGGNAPLWSLAYEVWFYILALLIGLLVLNPKLNFIPASAVVLVLCIFTYLSPTYMFCWLIGVMAYTRTPEKLSLQVLLIAIFLSIYSLIGIQIGYATVSVNLGYLQLYFPSLEICRILLAASAALIFQQLILVKPSKNYTIGLDRIGTKFAVFSYTLYLTHYPILELLSYFTLERSKEINQVSVGYFFVALLICLVVAWIMYMLFERHTNLVKSQLKNLNNTVKY
jgi:peptidoglycan/LPS O-acetylase OafA/YrhL